MHPTFREIRFSDEDIVNPGDFVPAGEPNVHGTRPWLFHDHGFCVSVVFADCLQDALDIAADNKSLDRYRVSDADLADYPDEEGLSFLGNESSAFDIEPLGVLELANPPFSFAALFRALNEPGK